jgi:hypothetical protein
LVFNIPKTKTVFVPLGILFFVSIQSIFLAF